MVTVIWGKLIHMTFKMAIGNQWNWRGDCGRQDGNGNGNLGEIHFLKSNKTAGNNYDSNGSA